MKTPATRLHLPFLGIAASLSLTQAYAQLDTLKEWGQNFRPLATDPGAMGGDDWYDTSARNSAPATGLPHGFTGPIGATNEYKITAGGADFYNNPCKGSFLYRNGVSTNGDFSAIVRSVSVAANTAEVLGTSWGRSGIMARLAPTDPNAASAPYATIYRRSGGSCLLQTRDSWYGNTNALDHNNYGAATTPSRTTPIWLGLHRKNNVWYSTWAPDNSGVPGTWSISLQRDPGPDDLNGPVYVGLAHQAHREGTNYEINTALFDNFAVAGFNVDLGQFPLTTSQSVTFSGNQVFLTTYGIEFDYPAHQDVNWSVEFVAPAVVVGTVPGLLANIYASGNNDGNWNNLVGNTLGVPTGKVVIPNPNWANPGAGNPPNGYPDADPNPNNGNSSSNLFETAAPVLGFESGGDGASDYGVHLTGEIFIPSDASRNGVETVRFHKGTDDRSFLQVDGVTLINRNGWSPWNGNDGDAEQAILNVSDAKFDDGEWVSIRVGMWEGGGGDNLCLVWDALDRTGTDSTTGAVDATLSSYLGDTTTDGKLRFVNHVSDIVPQQNLRTPPPPIPTISSGTGQPNGTVPLNVELTPETYELRVTINNELKLVVPTVPAINSAKFTGQDEATIVLSDVGNGGTRDVNPSTLVITRNGNPMTPSVSKSGVLTTIVDNSFPANDPYTNYTYVITGTTTVATGSVPFSFTSVIRSWPILAGLDTGLGTPPNASVGWSVVEYNAPSGGLGLGEEMFRKAQTAILENSVRSNGTGQIPYINHRDPQNSNYPFSGDWSNDLAFISDTGIDDNNFVTYARTIVTISAAGDRTFRIRGDDGYGLRVTGATFTSIAGNGNNRIHPEERSSAFYPGDTGNSDALAVCSFPAAGDYLVEFFGFEGTEGAHQEVSWAPGSFTATGQTSGWVLVGNTSGYVPTGESAFGTIPASVIPAIPSTPGWATRFWYDASNPQPWNLSDTCNFLRAVGAGATSGADYSANVPLLNYGDGGPFGNNQPFPGNTTNTNERTVTIAHARIVAPVSGDYTLQVRGDDGFLLRWDSTGDAFHTLNGLGTLHPNSPREAYFPVGTGDTDTRVSANLTAGPHDIVFIRWNGNGGNYFEVSAATGVVANHSTPAFELLSTTPSTTRLYIGAAAADDYAGTWGPAQNWTWGGPLTGKDDDYDGDGLTNEQERAFGLDPTKGDSVSPVIVPLDKASGTFTYTRRDPALGNLSYSYEWSTTLEGAWTPVIPAVADIVTQDGENQTVVVDLTGAPGNPLANDRLFVRVAAK